VVVSGRSSTKFALSLVKFATIQVEEIFKENKKSK